MTPVGGFIPSTPRVDTIVRHTDFGSRLSWYGTTSTTNQVASVLAKLQLADELTPNNMKTFGMKFAAALPDDRSQTATRTHRVPMGPQA